MTAVGLEVSEKSPPSSSESSNRPIPDAEWGFCLKGVCGESGEKEGQREEETSERGNFETRGEIKGGY